MGILTRRRVLTHTVALGALLACCLHPRAITAQSGRAQNELAVIVSKNSRVDNLTLRELKRIFTSERMTDPAGNRYIPLNHPPKTEGRIAFDLAVLKMTPHQVGRFWIDRKIRGEPSAPRTVEDEGTLRRVVARLPGSIGYVRATQLSPEVKAVRVEGRLPGEAGYPLPIR